MQAFCDKCTADDSRDSGEEEERGEGQKAGTVYFIYTTRQKMERKKTKERVSLIYCTGTHWTFCYSQELYF